MKKECGCIYVLRRVMMFSRSSCAESSLTIQSQKRRLTTSNRPRYSSGIGLKQSTILKSTRPLQFGDGNCFSDMSKAFTTAVSGSSAASSLAQILVTVSGVSSEIRLGQSYPVPAPKSTTLTLERSILIFGCSKCLLTRESHKWFRFSLQLLKNYDREIRYEGIPH